MSTNDDTKFDVTPSLRISRAVNDLLESQGNARGYEFLAADSHTNDMSFAVPAPLPWLRPSHADADCGDDGQPCWVSTYADSPKTGIIRSYTQKSVTHTETHAFQLANLRFTHKDNIAVKGYPLTAGNPSLNKHRAQITSPLLKSIEAAGGTIVGANHMAEFALSPTGHNQWLGNGVNPRNDSYLSGGSSSGSAIAVASNACEVSLGTDTGGSVRLPAAFCGVVGYKPSNGVFSHSGLIPLSETLDTIGLIAADATTVQKVAEVLFSDDEVVSTDACARLDNPETSHPAEFTHLSVSAAMTTCDPEVAASFTDALTTIGLIDSDDRNVTDFRHGVDYDDGELNRRSLVVVSVEAARNVGRILDWDWDLLGDQVLSRVIRGTAVSAIEYVDSLAERGALQSQFIESVMQGSRFLLTPTSPITAPRKLSADSAISTEYMRASRYTRTINYLGLPAISIPLPATPDSIYPGLQIIGRPYDDRALLECAVSLSSILG